MKLTIKTEIFKEMISRAIKGASQNKLIPITGLMAISLRGSSLTLITTDASNYLYIKQDNVVGDDFYVVIQVEQFSKLISKMTCESITLECSDNVLNVKGNGDYKIELPLDEEGNLIVFPDPYADVEITESTEVNIATIRTILNTVKPSLAVTMEVPVYTRYYVGDRVIATDTYKMASINSNILNTEPILISAEMMNLLDVMTCEKIGFTKIDNTIVFSSPDCLVYGHIMEGIEEYAIEPITELLDEEFSSGCKVDRNSFLSILDRISLFVSQYDNRAITLTFTDKGIDISSKASTGIETLTYLESDNPVPYTCSIDIEILTSQIKANVSETVDLKYGNENTIKIVDGNVIQVTALLED